MNFKLQQKRPKAFASISPRSGRTKIAQRFIAGYRLVFRTLVRKADDRIVARDSSPTPLSPASRALGKNSWLNPSTKGAGLFSFVRCADSNRLLFTLLVTFAIGLGASCSRQLAPQPTSLTRAVTDEAGRRVVLLCSLLRRSPGTDPLATPVSSGQHGSANT